MTRISTLPLRELMEMYNTACHLYRARIPQLNRTDLKKDLDELFAAIENKIPDTVMYEIKSTMKSIEERQLARIRQQQRENRRDTIKDWLVSGGLTIAILATIILMSYYGEEIHGFLKSIWP